MIRENPELQAKLEAYLTRTLGGACTITALSSLSAGGGACQDNYLLDITVAAGARAGRHELVFRTDKGGALYASISKADEYRVAQLAVEAGVKMPRPWLLEEKRGVTGNPFWIMERISGKANGRYIVKDRSLDRLRPRLALELAENLARIHTITMADNEARVSPALRRHRGNEPKSIALDTVEEVRAEIDRLQEVHPAMELIANWLEKSAPETDQAVLVHGDFRTGNFLVTPEGLQGIVDWEFAHWGDRHEDISWICMRDWRFGKLKKEVGGFADRAEFYAAYEKASGIAPDPARVRYWEVMGNLRWAVGSAGQTERHLSGQDKGIELAAIGRRTCEMEFEAMRLIEHAK